jgi:hypothetical protein
MGFVSILCRKYRLTLNRCQKIFLRGKEKGRPYLLVKSVLAGIFIWQCGKVIWRCMLVVIFVPREKWREHEYYSIHKNYAERFNPNNLDYQG